MKNKQYKNLMEVQRIVENHYITYMKNYVKMSGKRRGGKEKA